MNQIDNDNNAPQPADESALEAEPVQRTEPWDPWQELDNQVERWPRAVHYGWLAACIALCLINSFIHIASQGYLEHPNTEVVVVTLVLSAVSSGVALFGLGLFVVRRLQGVKSPIFQGEFLLLVSGLNFLSYFLFNRLPSILVGADALPWLTQGYQYIHLPTALIGSFVMLLCWKPATAVWRVFIVLFIVRNIWTAVWSVKAQSAPTDINWVMVYLLSLQIPTIILAVVALCDMPRRSKLPWTHWGGVGVYLLGSSIPMLPQIWDTMLPYLRALVRSLGL